MKKIQLNYKNWKIKKRYSFKFYFVLITMTVIAAASTISALFSEVIVPLIADIPNFVTTILVSLIIGLILSFFIGRMLISPIKKLQKMMDEVANGNFDVYAKEKSVIDEVEDIYHYFNLMMNELRATETIQSEFVSNVSHEFKTPLNAIDGYATLLTDLDLTNEEREKYINKILYNTRRMNELIGSILLISKVDNQSIDSKKKTYSLDEQIRQSILFLEPKWSDKNINFDVDLDLVTYNGNASLMMHVWNNLIDNAIKFSPVSSTITITLKKEINKIIFTISDEGCGILEENMPFIFNKFYQSDVSHQGDGNGLGLALVKKILDLNNNQIEVKNLQPKGVSFKVTLYT